MNDPEIKQMNSEFARRIRSFLMGKEWMEVAQTLQKAEVDEESLWTHMIAGIIDLEDEDFQFARAMNWSATREELILPTVAGYAESLRNWWYIIDKPNAVPGILYIKGTVPVRLIAASNEQKAREEATAFVTKAVRPDLLGPREFLAASSNAAKTEWDITGIIGVK